MTTDFAQHKYAQKPALGLLGFFTSRERTPLLEEDKRISDAIALLKRAQKTIETAERVISEQTKRIQSLEAMNTTDELTGLLNYRGFEQAFAKERSRLQRGAGLGGMIIVVEMENYDHVKAKYGKAAAEACLKLTGGILRDEIRGMDSAARIKKDEFVLLFSGASINAALDRTQKLASKINKLSIIKGSQEIRISASISLQDFNVHTEFHTLFKTETEASESKKRAETETILDVIQNTQSLPVLTPEPKPSNGR